jgi:hypothetical protein
MREIVTIVSNYLPLYFPIRIFLYWILSKGEEPRIILLDTNFIIPTLKIVMVHVIPEKVKKMLRYPPSSGIGSLRGHELR